ncbi:MAG: hypothetical protein K6E92_03255 [Lachnospiraceae bacterium]|nr:hypothetical protein [Lachnospiraceae bacterium]
MGKGSERVYEKIRASRKSALMLGLVMLAAGALPAALLFALGKAAGVGLVIALLCAVLAAFGVCRIAAAAVILADPGRSRVIRLNPQLPALADELFEKKTYEDRCVMLSDRIIANAEDVTQMSPLEEVYLIYLYSHKTDNATDRRVLRLETKTGRMELDVAGKEDAQIEELANRIKEKCPNAMLGHTAEGLAHLEKMRG